MLCGTRISGCSSARPSVGTYPQPPACQLVSIDALCTEPHRPVCLALLQGLLKMRAACRLAAQVLDYAGTLVAPGVTTDTIDRAVHKMTTDAGAYPSPLNYGKFPKSVCTSVNEVACHGIPDDRWVGRTWEEGMTSCSRKLIQGVHQIDWAQQRGKCRNGYGQYNFTLYNRNIIDDRCD
jgi:hypothetical protein